MFRKAEIFYIFHQSLAAPAARNGQNVSAVLKLYKCLNHVRIQFHSAFCVINLEQSAIGLGIEFSVKSALREQDCGNLHKSESDHGSTLLICPFRKVEFPDCCLHGLDDHRCGIAQSSVKIQYYNFHSIHFSI